jgi:hypothetical protein
MKNGKMKIYVAFFLICMGISGKVGAQVTIGSGKAPLHGALLQLKETDDAVDKDNNVALQNANKGLLLPRVKLKYKDQLYPMFDEADPSYPNDKNNIDRMHTGLTVYNIADVPEQGFKPGAIYIWDGASWNPVKGGGGGPRFFYMPSFDLRYDDYTSDNSVNLYRAYRMFFTKEENDATPFITGPNSTLTEIPNKENTIYEQGEIEFVVTGYDTTTFRAVSIDADDNLHYIVNTLPTQFSCMNIVIVVKE